ncbi:MAG: glycosyltransferase family 87 protein [Mycobacteriales bacterium]
MTAPLVLPSRDDPVVAGAVEAVGGPPGRHARLGERRYWTTTRVLLALTLLTSLLGFAQKAPCRDGSTWVHEHQYTRGCYSDVVALYSAERLSEGKLPYYEHPVEYPVVIGGVMQLSSLLTRAVTAAVPDSRTRTAQAELDRTGTPAALSARDYARTLERGRHFYDITWVVVTICALVVTVTLARLAGRRPWDAAMFALSPALLLHATTNWDLVAMAFAGLGLLAWARRHPAWAGVFLGLATATKLYPVLFLVPLLLLCVRARQTRAWGVAAALTVAVAVGLTAPVYLTAPSFSDGPSGQVKVLDAPLSRLGSEGLRALAPHQTVGGVVATNAVYRFFDLNKTRGADWDSLYLQVQHLRTGSGHLMGLRNSLADLVTDSTAPPTRLNRWVAILVLLVMVGIASLALLAPRRPRLPQLLFLTVAGFLLVNKVDSPQYVLWLVPLAVLARPRWRPFLAWQAAEALVLFARFYFFVGNDKPGQGIAIGWYFAAVLLRDLLLVVFAALVVRDVLRPELDVVRADGVDDPAGGVLDGAPDRAPVPV